MGEVDMTDMRDVTPPACWGFPQWSAEAEAREQDVDREEDDLIVTPS